MTVNPTVESLDLIPDEVNVTFISQLFGVRRATASYWVQLYQLQYRISGTNKLIPKHEVARLAQERNNR